MAVSDLLPRKMTKGRSRLQTMRDRIGYDMKEEKTADGALISAYMCCPESAAEEFEMSRLLYEKNTGRKQPESRDIIAYRLIQSCAPGEITPEDANKLGYELAMEFTKGRHQFVVSTHVDKAHIHNHVEFNSVNLDCDGKFNNFKNSSFALRELNDRLCREHGYSVIENPKARGQRYQEKAAAKRGRSHKERLRRTIDRILPKSRDFDDFLNHMRDEGYEVKWRGKSLEFKNGEQERFTRSYRLGEDYTEEALRQRVGKSLLKQTERKNEAGKYHPDRKVNLLVDIEAKLKTGKGKGYERWAQVFNIKEAAKTLNFLTEKGITGYGELAARAEKSAERFDIVSGQIRELEERIAKNRDLQKHIINYAQTVDVYRAYRKAKNKTAYRAVHAEELEKHEAAKRAFDAWPEKPIPKTAQLSEEFAALLKEKKACYSKYRAARKEMIEYQNAKQNVDRLLGITRLQEKPKEKEHGFINEKLNRELS